jgi:hypothetical protein
MTLDSDLDRLAPASGWEPDWADVLHRAGEQRKRRSPRLAFPPGRRARRLLVIGLLAAGVVAIATPALGVIGAIRDLFEGTPPTPLVQQHFMAWNQLGRRATHSPRWNQLQVNASKAHGVLAIRTSDGPVYLWVAPTRSGGTCWLLQFVNHKSTATQSIGPSGCLGTTLIGSSIAWWGILPSPSVWRDGVGASSASFGILIGQAFGDASYLIVESSRHPILRVPVVEHFFAAVVPAEPTIHKITSYDSHGKQLAESAHRNF